MIDKFIYIGVFPPPNFSLQAEPSWQGLHQRRIASHRNHLCQKQPCHPLRRGLRAHPFHALIHAHCSTQRRHYCSHINCRFHRQTVQCHRLAPWFCDWSCAAHWGRAIRAHATLLHNGRTSARSCSIWISGSGKERVVGREYGGGEGKSRKIL